jgi:hypothetical protein
MNRNALFLFLIVLCLGCGKPETSTPSGQTTAQTPSGNGGRSTTDPVAKPAAEPSPSGSPSVDSISAELKHEGYEYYGLGNTEPMDLEYVTGQGVGTVTGSQVVKLKEVKDGEAIFTIERTGGLADLGNEEISLGKDGVYTTSSSMGTLAEPTLNMAAKLTPGARWKSSSKLDSPRGEFSVTSDYTVVGTRKVKTKAGEREALLIRSTGKGTLNGQSVRMETKGWFVRGRGGVRLELRTIPEKGKPSTLTIQETK